MFRLMKKLPPFIMLDNDNHFNYSIFWGPSIQAMS
jgi:hypothetical protein